MIWILFAAMCCGVAITYFRYKKLMPEWDVYRIKKGRHFSRMNHALILYKFEILFKNRLEFDVIFANGCDYEDNSDGDINKLYGVSYGFDNHWRSVRIGWLYNSKRQKIELYSYVYIRGERIITYLCDTDLGEDLNISIDHNVALKEVYIRISDNSTNRMLKLHIVKNVEKSWIRLKEFPYYGGNFAAPSDMMIFIKDVK